MVLFGDGITDDTLAIRAAINYINSDSETEFFTLYFPKGTYKVSILRDSYGEGVKFNSEGYMTTITTRINCGNVIKLTNTTAKAIIIDFGDSTLKLTENSYPSWQVVSAERNK